MDRLRRALAVEICEGFRTAGQFGENEIGHCGHNPTLRLSMVTIIPSGIR